MRGCLPAFGNAAWQVTLSGCRRALGAILYPGTNNTNSGGVPLPLDLALIGMDESDLLIDPTTSFPPQLFNNGNAQPTWSVPPPPILSQQLPLHLQLPSTQFPMGSRQGPPRRTWPPATRPCGSSMPAVRPAPSPGSWSIWHRDPIA